MNLPKVLTDGFLLAMPEDERAKLGKAGMTSEEATRRFERGEEKKLQVLIANWLHLHNHYFIRPRMDKKTTTAKGTPDFIACIKDPLGNGRFLAIEAKTKYGTLSVEQMATMAKATQSGAAYCVARSLDDVIKIIEIIVMRQL